MIGFIIDFWFATQLNAPNWIYVLLIFALTVRFICLIVDIIKTIVKVSE